MTVDVDKVTWDCGVKARSIENGALGKPTLWASVPTGVTPAAVSLVNVYIEIQARRREQMAAI